MNQENTEPELKPDRDANCRSTGIDPEPEATLVDTVPESETAERTEVESQRTSWLQLPGYTALSKLGQGGMGSVFLALDEKLGRRVAIKVIAHRVLHAHKAVERFSSEIQTVAALKHPHIVQLYTAGEHHDVPYYVMEFIDGPTLDDRIDGSPIEPRAAAELVVTLAKAVDYCHQQGVVHRDLKPSNILIDGEQPKIADFGLAKAIETDVHATQTGEILGTPAYMAPEQALGDSAALGPATDVYGLGAILYFTLTGRPPFNAPSSVNMLAQVVSDDPARPRNLQSDIPRDIETICLKCLEKKPHRRYPTAAALADDMQRYLDEKPIMARPVGMVERMSKWIRRHPAAATFLIGLALAVPAVIGGLVYYSGQMTASLRREQEALADTERALEEAERELQRANRLSDEGSELTAWLLDDYSAQLRQLAGSVPVRHELARRIGEYLERATPDMPERAKFVRRFGNAYYRLGMTLGGEDDSSLGQTGDALPLMDKSIRLFDRALEIDPDDSVTRNLKIRSLIGKASVERALGDTETASDSLKQARVLLDEDSDDLSKDRRFARVLLLQAEFGQQKAGQKLSDALKTLDRLEAAIESGPEAPLLPDEITHQMIWVLRHRGVLLREMGESGDELQRTMSRAVEMSAAAYEADPDNPILLNRYAGVLTDQAVAWFDLQKFEPAADQLLQALALYEEYARQNPQDIFSQYNLAVVFSRLHDVSVPLQQSDKQLEYAGQAARLFRELADENPQHRDYQRELAKALASQALAHSTNGQTRQAREILDEALAIATRLADTDSPSLRDLEIVAEIEFEYAMVYVRSWARDMETESAIENEDFRSAVKWLDRCLATGHQMDRLGELNVQQKRIQQSAEQAKTLLFDTAEQSSKALNQGDQAD